MTVPSERTTAQTGTAGQPGTTDALACHLDIGATDTAARLLNGAGKATVVCHDGERGYTLDTVFHGAAADGRRYVVAAPHDDAWPTMVAGTPLRVAMTICTDAPVAEIRMNTAELSGHAWLTRCTAEEELALLAEGPMPSDVAQTLACWPFAQLWHLQPARMTVHHVHGTHVLDHQALEPRPAWPTPDQQIAAVEAMRSQWGTYLTEIVPALKAAATVTEAFPDAPGSVHCATGRAYPVAVTDRDVSFLVAEGARRETVVIPLPGPARSVDSLMEHMRHLVSSH